MKDALETYADIFTNELQNEFSKSNEYLMPRFSPGYGDFKIENQPEFLKATDSMRRCAVTLTDSLLLTPSKSITGIIGISKTNKCNRKTKCKNCSMTNCNFRKIDEVTKNE